MIEIIALTVEDARRIEVGGGGRIELISAMSEGGLTPSYGLVEAVVKAVKIPVNVMIRPHSDGFVYTDEEIELMKQDICQAKRLGANGVVLGVLTAQNEVDTQKLEALLGECQGLEVTFHRAVDETDVVGMIQVLSRYPQITSVLTSGGATPIGENVEVLQKMMDQKGHLDLLLGAGLKEENVLSIQKATLATSFHFGSAARTGQRVDVNKVRRLKAVLERK